MLTVAITSALMAGSGVATAVDQFRNVHEGMIPPVHDTTYIPPQPLSSFNFSGNETLIKGDKDGVTYASELFGSGSSSLTMPSGTTNGIGTYAAVVYTVDGTISKKFDMTFTLTNGATFAGTPTLGIDITSATPSSVANATVTIDYSAGTSNIQINPKDIANVPTSIQKNAVIQFSPSA